MTIDHHMNQSIKIKEVVNLVTGPDPTGEEFGRNGYDSGGGI